MATDEKKQYKVNYSHKIRPNPNDNGPDVELTLEERADIKKLAAALRRQRAGLSTGERLREMRQEPSGVLLAFPSKGIWHCIKLTPKD